MLKRTFDIVAGTVLALIVLPVIVVLAVAVACTLRCNPIFVQQRVGRNGQAFRCIKLRTLPPSTPRDASKYDIDVDRLPPICRLVRRTHLDELPQILLVVWGSMSLVGPRPEMPRLHHAMDATFASARIAVAPGCTGLWQISADSGRMISEAPAYDLFYVRERNLRLDLWIMWRTFLLMCGAGGIDLVEIPSWARSRSGSLALSSAHAASEVA